MTVNDLQTLLKKHESFEQIEFGIHFKDRSRISVIEELEQYCAKLFNALCDAKKCVEIVKEQEERKNRNEIYYDRLRGHNEGAKALNEYLEDLMKNHYEKMLHFSLFGQ